MKPQVSVRLFARVREVAGTDVVAVPATPGMTVADLRKALADHLPAAADLLNRSAVAVNADYAGDTEPLSAADDVAIIPPVSGG